MTFHVSVNHEIDGFWKLVDTFAGEKVGGRSVMNAIVIGFAVAVDDLQWETYIATISPLSEQSSTVAGVNADLMSWPR